MKKTKLKRWMAGGLCLAMVSGSGLCPVTAYAEEEPMEITIAYWDVESAFVGDDVLTQIEEKLNIKLTPVNISWDDYSQKLPLWASSGSLPDVFVGDFRSSKTFSEWASQGIIHAIPDDLSAYPNLEEYMSNEDIVSSAVVDGTVYCIPRKSYPSQAWTAMDREIAYRWDLAQEAGITEEPTTWEEFDTMIQAIIAADPEGNGIQGMTATTKGLFAGMFLPYSSAVACDSGIDYKWVMDDDGQYKPAYFAEDLLPALQLLRDLYDDGTIETDIALTNNQSAREKFLQGKSAAILYAGGAGSDNYNNVAKYWESVHGTNYLDDVKVLNLMPDEDGNITYPVWGYAWSESYINASVSDEKLEKILELYDYLLSDEGSLLGTYGPEGELYDMVDGKAVLHDGVTVADVYPSTGVFSNLVRWTPSTYDETYATDWPDEYNEINRKIVSQAKSVEIPEYNTECSQAVKKLGLEFSLDLETDVITIMTGTDSVEDMWQDIVAQYQSNGLDDVISQVNAEISSED